jgi:hypothetical protein
MKSIIRSLLALAAMTAASGVPAVAQEATWYDKTTTALQSAAATAADYVSSAIDYVKPESRGGLLSKRLREETKESPYDFKGLMDAAGYKVKEVETGVGLVPYLSFTFGQARELAEHDVIHVQRLLKKHGQMRSGPVAYAERAIVSAVLDVQEMKTYTLEKVQVDFLPVPKVKFIAVPADAPLSDEGSRIMQAIDRLNNSLANNAKR